MRQTETDLLQAIAEAMQNAEGAVLDGPLGVTAAEIADYLDKQPDGVSKLLRKAVKAGYLVVEKGFRVNIVGDMHRPPVYRPKAE